MGQTPPEGYIRAPMRGSLAVCRRSLLPALGWQMPMQKNKSIGAETEEKEQERKPILREQTEMKTKRPKPKRGSKETKPAPKHGLQFA